MAEKADKLSKERGLRAKWLFEWWNNTHPEDKRTQAQLADYMSDIKDANILPTVINAKLNCARTLTDDDARIIATFFPGSRLEYLLCIDDFPTVEEKREHDRQQRLAEFNATFSDLNKEAELLFRGLDSFATLCGYRIELSSPASEPSVEEYFKMVKDGYLIQDKNGKGVRLTLEELNDFENECLEFIQLKLKHLVEHNKGGKNG